MALWMCWREDINGIDCDSYRKCCHSLGLLYGMAVLMTTRALKLNTGKSLKVLSSLEEQFALQVRAAKLPEPRREYQFHQTRKWRFDFAWPVPNAVAVELHGATYANGRHNRGAGFEADRFKINEAQLLGWLVIEATGAQVKNGQALAWLTRALSPQQ